MSDLLGRGGGTPAVAVEVPSAISTILATSASGQYERVPNLPTGVRLKAFTLPLQAVADAIASPPGGKTWLNSGALSSAAQATGYLQMSFNVASPTDWTSSGTHTQPVLGAAYTGLVVAGITRSVTTFVQIASTAVNTRGAGLIIYNTSNQNSYVRILSLYDAGSYKVYADTASGFASTAVTSAEWTTGVWLRLRIFGTTVVCEYATGTTRPPNDAAWTTVRSDVTFALGDSLTAGRTGLTLTDTTTAFAPKFLTFDDTLMASASDVYGQVPANACTSCGYVTSPEALTLIPSADFGVPVAISQSTVRTMLASAINNLPGDAAAWTFSVVGGASPNPAAGSYAAAGSVTVTGTFRYWAVYAKCTSDGSQAGSIDTALVRLTSP